MEKFIVLTTVQDGNTILEPNQEILVNIEHITLLTVSEGATIVVIFNKVITVRESYQDVKNIIKKELTNGS